MENLFSYRTLQYEAVQICTFGSRLAGTADTLRCFNLFMVKIENTTVVATSGRAEHPIISRTDNRDDIVYGMVLEVTDTELLQADEYEAGNYKRISVTLQSGKDAWVYVNKDTPS